MAGLIKSETVADQRPNARVELHETFLQPLQFTLGDCVAQQKLAQHRSFLDLKLYTQLERFSMSSINWDAVTRVSHLAPDL
jgi:hypothetical protein